MKFAPWNAAVMVLLISASFDPALDLECQMRHVGQPQRQPAVCDTPPPAPNTSADDVPSPGSRRRVGPCGNGYSSGTPPLTPIIRR
jgi:hypothetical protein